jgi:hypothetical protein
MKRQANPLVWNFYLIILAITALMLSVSKWVGLQESHDRVLAQHYGFTAEELDFIINYDIKYRMGRDSGGDD